MRKFWQFITDRFFGWHYKILRSIKMASKKEESIILTFSPSAAMKQVSLVGDFNQWKVGVDPMKKVHDGSFRITKKLSWGRYEYKFYADGVYWDDPQAKGQTVNSFGTRNSVLKVG
jgi:1,4-alpha-glucan branching enzyme